jgi:hypothetical protein
MDQLAKQVLIATASALIEGLVVLGTLSIEP